MTKKREYRSEMEDLFEDWFERFLPRRSGRGLGMDLDIFDEFEKSFGRTERWINRLVKDASTGKLPSPEEGGPYVYGWTFRIGLDGKPEFQEFGNMKGSPPGAPKEMIGSREPLVDVNETDEAVNITAEVPGVSKDDINLEITEDSLVINVDSKERKYYKGIALPAGVHRDSASASYKNGVLEVKLERSRPEKAGKKLQIK